MAEKCFEQDSQVIKDFERGKTSDVFERRQPELQHLQPFFARAATSLGHKRSESSLQAPSDELSQTSKGGLWNFIEFVGDLEEKGTYMYEFKDGCKQEHVEGLLYFNQTVPEDSLFHPDLFDKICRKTQDRNEALVVQDITRLIVPSAVNLAIYGAKHLDHLYECVNEG